MPPPRQQAVSSTAAYVGVALALEQALAVCTIEGAHVLGVEDNLGSIAQGKQADMIILDQNPFEIDEDQIGDTKVLQTILNGEVVFER